MNCLRATSSHAPPTDAFWLFWPCESLRLANHQSFLSDQSFVTTNIAPIAKIPKQRKEVACDDSSVSVGLVPPVSVPTSMATPVSCGRPNIPHIRPLRRPVCYCTQPQCCLCPADLLPANVLAGHTTYFDKSCEWSYSALSVRASWIAASVTSF
jgi:hypothetical protein